MYGVIDESHFTFISPRAIDDGPFDTLSEAFDAAYQMIDGGINDVTIVRVKSNKSGDCWTEDPDQGSILIDASHFKFDE